MSQIENGIELSFSKGVKERFQHVIFALPAPDLSRIAKTLFPKTKLLLQSVQYASTIVIAFWIPADAFPKEKIVLVPKQESSLIVSYCNQGCKYPPYGDKSLIVLFLEDRAARSLMQESDELIFMKVREELIPCCPPLGKIAKSAIEPYKLKRWKRAMPIFSPNHFRLVHELLEEEKRNPSITLCGDYLNAPWIEGAFRSGRAAADRLIDKISLRV